MFIIKNAIYTYFALKLYGMYLFINLFNLDSSTSMDILIITTLVFVVIGVILTFKHRRNSLSIGINIMFPLALYSILGYFRYTGLLIVILLLFSVLAGIIYILMTRQYSSSKVSKNNKKFSIKRFSLLGVRTIVTTCCSILIVFLVGSTISGNQLYKPSIDAATASADNSEYLIENNIDTIVLLESCRWKELDIEAKITVLQTVANIERSKLGIITHPIYVKSKPFFNELLGCYDNKTNTALINTKHLEEDNSLEVLETALHEVYHAYEQSLIELFDSTNDEYKSLAVFNNSIKYKEEFLDYKSADQYEEYMHQTCESDARSYAQYEVQVYKNIINDYKKKG